MGGKLVPLGLSRLELLTLRRSGKGAAQVASCVKALAEAPVSVLAGILENGEQGVPQQWLPFLRRIPSH